MTKNRVVEINNLSIWLYDTYMVSSSETIKLYLK